MTVCSAKYWRISISIRPLHATTTSSLTIRIHQLLGPTSAYYTAFSDDAHALPNTVTPTPYDMSNHHTPHTEMPRGPQPSSQGWSYPGTNEREYGSDYPMDEYSEQNPQGMSDLQKRSLRSFPFAFGTKSHGKRPGKGSPSSSPTPDQLPCRLCQKLTPSHIIEHWGGFCCERHRTQWMCSPTPDQLPCRLCHKLTPRHIIEHWGGFCCERHKTQWNAVYG